MNMNRTARADEICGLNRLSEQEVEERAGENLLVLEGLDELHRWFADHVCDLIARNNAQGKATAGVFPFGPVGQYPLFIERVNREGISLARTTFYFMDEYCDPDGREVEEAHPLSFRSKLYDLFAQIDKRLLPNVENVVFPSHDNLPELADRIAAQPLDVTYGGVGIHGHLAFNEPAPGVRESDPYMVGLNDFTVTINAIRAGIGGNLEGFPRHALTLGMKQLFAAEKMVIFCRNGTEEIDWANTVLRLALFGTPGDDYPVTYLKQHPDWLVVTDRNTLKTPIAI